MTAAAAGHKKVARKMVSRPNCAAEELEGHVRVCESSLSCCSLIEG